MNDKIYPTALLKQLRVKGLLNYRLKWLGLENEEIHSWLIQLDRKGSSSQESVPKKEIIQILYQYKLITDSKPSLKKKSRQSVPLPFVTAVNLELTYSCNISCSHCLQAGIRSNRKCGWLSTEIALRAIDEAWFAGLLSAGINFTGGEIITARSNLPEILEKTRSMDLSARVNSNGWWGKKDNINIGGTTFKTVSDLILWLIDHNVIMLALSFDNRYAQYPDLLDSVINIIKVCDEIGFDCQFITTGMVQEKTIKFCESRVIAAGIDPHMLNFAPTDMVDIGGSNQNENTSLNESSLANPRLLSGCVGKGFTRPSVLHINPDGGVRSCLFAPGSAALGNINRSSLFDIINGFIENPVVQLFKSGNFQSFVAEYFEPHKDIYRYIKHPCACSALLSRFAEELNSSEQDIRSIHLRIAEEYNLTRAENTDGGTI